MTIEKSGRELLLEAVRKKDGSGVFYIYGSNEEEKRRIVKFVSLEAPDEMCRDFNFAERDARELNGELFAELLSQPIYLAGRRVVIIQCADKLSDEARHAWARFPEVAIEEVLLLLVNTPHTDRDESLARLEGIVLVECK
ncbi:hypothetical protein KW796_00705 [Candidatus Parcubacteria bacterium]|nr:hypothetical protein [Candidatus Parcubacteria bacterium]